MDTNSSGRCKAIIPWINGSTKQCAHRAKIDGFCKKHVPNGTASPDEVTEDFARLWCKLHHADQTQWERDRKVMRDFIAVLENAGYKIEKVKP